jgi:hypothetical protein
MARIANMYYARRAVAVLLGVVVVGALCGGRLDQFAADIGKWAKGYQSPVPPGPRYRGEVALGHVEEPPKWREVLGSVLGRAIVALSYGSLSVGAYWFVGGRPRAQEQPSCRRCGYILKGLSEPRCPECGEHI